MTGLFSGPWDKKLLSVEGTKLSLNDIEHRILRPIWEDPRNHYALNCASIGCPHLQKTAYTSENLEVLLDSAAREYLAHSRALDLGRSQLTLSSIYDWFASDFGGSEESIIDHIQNYVDPDVADALKAFNGRIRYRYDWSLNEP